MAFTVSAKHRTYATVAAARQSLASGVLLEGNAWRIPYVDVRTGASKELRGSVVGGVLDPEPLTQALVPFYVVGQDATYGWDTVQGTVSLDVNGNPALRVTNSTTSGTTQYGIADAVASIQLVLPVLTRPWGIIFHVEAEEITNDTYTDRSWGFWLAQTADNTEWMSASVIDNTTDTRVFAQALTGASLTSQTGTGTVTDIPAVGSSGDFYVRQIYVRENASGLTTLAEAQDFGGGGASSASLASPFTDWQPAGSPSYEVHLLHTTDTPGASYVADMTCRAIRILVDDSGSRA